MNTLTRWITFLVLCLVTVPSGHAQVGSFAVGYSFMSDLSARCSAVLQSCNTELSRPHRARHWQPANEAFSSIGRVEGDTGRVQTGWLIAGGVAGGLFAVGVGAVGISLCQANADPWDWCLGPAFLAIGTEILAVPLGVHLANGAKGNYFKELLASVGVFTLGTMLRDDVGRGAFLLIPAGQIGASIAIERRAR